MIENRPILVTGAAGLLGTELALLLRSHGYAVAGVDDCSRYDLIGETGSRPQGANVDELKAAGVEFNYTNVRAFVEAGEMRRPFAAVVHAAAQVCHSRKVDSVWDNVEVNYLQTNLLLDAARANRVPFLFVSSAKIYAHQGIPLGSHSPLGDRTPMTFFGATKMAADVLAQQYGFTFDFPVGVLRPGCFTGPRALATEAQNWMSWLIHCNLTGRPFNLFGSGWQTREVMHVADFADACARWIERPTRGTWAVGAGAANSIALNTAIDVVEKATGKRTVIVAKPPRPGDMPYLVVEGSAFTLDYGWRPTRSVEAIVRELIEAHG